MIFESERLSFRLIEQGDLDDLFNNIWGNNGAVDKVPVHLFRAEQ